MNNPVEYPFTSPEEVFQTEYMQAEFLFKSRIFVSQNIENRITEIENILKHAKPIAKKKGGKVDLGSKVIVQLEKGEQSYHIVGATEANIDEGKIEKLITSLRSLKFAHAATLLSTVAGNVRKLTGKNIGLTRPLSLVEL